MKRQPSKTKTTSPVVHHSPAGRRPVEAPVIDMEEIWGAQQVENAKWIALYGSLVQGAMAGAMARPVKDGDDGEINLDYEGLAAEADHAYSRYAARVRNQR